jgi:low affinity Fe/Cu permease
MRDRFDKLARKSSNAVGSPWGFGIALIVVVLWALSGPVFGFSDTWQLIINTATTISTGLIVFLVQHAQNHESKALHAKLDELILKLESTEDRFVGLEERPESDLESIRQEVREQASRQQAS